jgi:NAD(P)-dependent dehydrogenase (short-subunit alcohol dehydrogenase family)
MDLGLDGEAAVVTASSSGLGKAAATALAREGVDVVVNGRDRDRLDEAVADIQTTAADNTTVLGHPGDITDPELPAALVSAAVDEFGRLDHLVTSAGGPPPGLLLETTDDDWYAAFDLLVMSVVRTVRAAADHLQANDGGSIVTITSRTVKEASDSIVLSNAVRMAVVGLQKTLSRELAPAVRTNALLPGAHETSRIQNLMSEAVARGEYDDYEAARADRVAGIPVGFMGAPLDLGNAVAYLCSEQARYVNGVAIPVDGGEHRSTL